LAKRGQGRFSEIVEVWGEHKIPPPPFKKGGGKRQKKIFWIIDLSPLFPPPPPFKKGGDKKGGNCCKIPLNPPFSKGDVKSNG